MKTCPNLPAPNPLPNLKSDIPSSFYQFDAVVETDSENALMFYRVSIFLYSVENGILEESFPGY